MMLQPASYPEVTEKSDLNFSLISLSTVRSLGNSFMSNHEGTDILRYAWWIDLG
jgi:hypothetical protein